MAGKSIEELCKKERILFLFLSPFLSLSLSLSLSLPLPFSACTMAVSDSWNMMFRDGRYFGRGQFR